MTFTTNLNPSEFNNDSRSIHHCMNIERLMQVENEVSNQMAIRAKASKDWRDDPAECYRELLESKCMDHREVMSIEMFMQAMSGNQVMYIARLKAQFIQMRTGE